MTEVGCSWGGTRLQLVTRDLRTSIYLLNLELREECSRTLGWNPAGAASGCGEQQSKRTQSGEQQLKRTHDRGAAVEADAIGEQQPKRTRSGSAAEADAIEEQQLEADANGEQQLKRTQSGSSSSAQRAVRRRITHGRRTRGK